MYNFQNSTQDINENNILISECFKVYEEEGKENFDQALENKIREQLEIINNDKSNALGDIKEILNLSELEEITKLTKLKEIIENILNENVIYQDLDTKVKEKLNLLINGILAIDTINNNSLTKSILEKYKNKLSNLTNNVDTILNFENKIQNFLEQNQDLKKIVNTDYLKNLGINIDNNLNTGTNQECKKLGLN